MFQINQCPPLCYIEIKKNIISMIFLPKIHNLRKYNHEETQHINLSWGTFYTITDLYFSKNNEVKESKFSSVQFSCSVMSDSSWPHGPQTPGLPVHHQLPELTQTHLHVVGDAIQPSHPLSSPSPPALNLSQHQSLFEWVSSSHQVAKVLEFQLQHQSFQWTPRTDLL